MRCSNSICTQRLRDDVLKDFIQAEIASCSSLSFDERVQMILHHYVCTDPCSMRRPFSSETQKSFVNCWRRKNVATVLRTSGDEEIGDRPNTRSSRLRRHFRISALIERRYNRSRSRLVFAVRTTSRCRNGTRRRRCCGVPKMKCECRRW
jgi:hypothetical protein